MHHNHKRYALWLIAVQTVFLIAVCAVPVRAKERGDGTRYTQIPNSVSVYWHAASSAGSGNASYIMIEAEEQMCPPTAIQVTFTENAEHRVWAARANGEQIVFDPLGAGTHTIALPDDTAEVGMIVYGGEEDALDVHIPGAAVNLTAYTGRYVSVLGDSLSSVEMIGSLEEDTEGLNVASKWWYIAANELGMNVLTDGAVGSVGIGVDAPDGAQNSGLHTCTRLHTASRTPDCIFILLGINDLLTGKDLREVEETYRQMIDRTKTAYPHADLILFTYPYLGDGTDSAVTALLELYVPQMNGVVRKVAGEYGLSCVDLYECGITADNIASYVRKPGDIHNNRAGQALMGEAAVKGLLEISGRS